MTRRHPKYSPKALVKMAWSVCPRAKKPRGSGQHYTRHTWIFGHQGAWIRVQDKAERSPASHPEVRTAPPSHPFTGRDFTEPQAHTLGRALRTIRLPCRYARPSHPVYQARRPPCPICARARTPGICGSSRATPHRSRSIARPVGLDAPQGTGRLDRPRFHDIVAS